MAYVYPAMRYHNDGVNRCIVSSEHEDKALGSGWSDPAGVRSKADKADDAPDPEPEPERYDEHKRRGRKPKVI